MWTRKGVYITNEKGKIFDVQGGIDAENREVIAYKKHGKINQQFDIIYKD
jgi:hypothetical protein